MVLRDSRLNRLGLKRGEVMTLLSDEDYKMLAQRGFLYEEDLARRFFIFKDYPLPTGLYNVDTCDVLVVIPGNYSQDGNDMFWTFPRLVRNDGNPIPNIEPTQSLNNHTHAGREYCRWSRHWLPNTPGAWRPGKDNIISIQRRIEWAFQHPETR